MAGRSAKVTPVDPNAPKLSPQEQAALQLKLDAAFKVFARRWRGYTDPKDRQDFVARVVSMSDEPFQYTHPTFGDTRWVSEVKVELVEPGLEGIRFIARPTDNPHTNTVTNPDSALNHLVRAATGLRIPERGTFTWDTNDVVGKLVIAVIERGKDNPGGPRGGLYSEVKDFKKYVPPAEDEEEEEPAPKPLPRATAPRRRPTPELEVDPELDDVPF